MDELNEADDGEGWGDAGEEPGLYAASGPPPAWRRPAAPATAVANVSGPTADEVADHYATHLAETSSSAFMYFSMAGVFRQADAPAFKKYRDRLLADCGGPTDPIEIMLIEQLALAHLNTGRLHYKSASAEGLEAARTYGALAVALAGEMRRTALAIKTYRVRPQAATAGAGLPASADAGDSGGESAEDGADGEQESEPKGGEHDEATIALAPESAKGRGGPEEPGQTSRPKRRRA